MSEGHIALLKCCTGFAINYKRTDTLTEMIFMSCCSIQKRLATLIFTILVLVSATSQVPNSSAGKAWIHVPRYTVLPVLAYQPASPLKLEKVQIVQSVKGGAYNPIIVFRNASKKTITSYEIAYRYVGGGYGSWFQEDVIVKPEDKLPRSGEAKQPSLLLKESTRVDSTTVQDKMQSICIVFVVYVKFSDGTIFQDEVTLKNLEKYLDQL
jgi:hypothetical protein